MKILIVTHLFPKDEDDFSCTYVLDAINALKMLGHEIVVLWVQPWKVQKNISVTLRKTFSIEKCTYLSIPRYHLRRFSDRNLVRNVEKQVEFMIRKHGCELIHAHSELLAGAIVNVAQKLKVPTIATLHGFETNQRYWRGSGALIAKGLNNVNRVIAVGDSLMSYYATHMQKSDHIRVIHNGFRTVRGHEKVSLSKQIIRFISVANLNDEGKRVDIILRALAEINHAGITNWTYTVAGDGCLRSSLEALSNTLELRNKVVFLGACKHNQVYAELAKSDVFCLPSCPEAFGIAHLEAMGHGLLTIAARGQGPEAYITHLKTGLLVEPQNIASLALHLKMVFEEKQAMERVAEAGQCLVSSQFTWAHHAEKLETLYNELLG